MTFFMVAGISCTIAAVICVLVYFIAHNMDEHSTASKIIIWVGTLLGLAGASLLTIEYSFPSISHPYVKTVRDRFVEYYGEMYYSFIKQNTEHTVVDEFVGVTHTLLKEREDPEGGPYLYAFFRTDVVYEVDLEYYSISILNEYVHDAEYDYQNVISWRI